MSLLYTQKYLVGSFQLLDFALQLCGTQIGRMLLSCRVTWRWLLTFILQILEKKKKNREMAQVLQRLLFCLPALTDLAAWA